MSKRPCMKKCRSKLICNKLKKKFINKKANNKKILIKQTTDSGGYIQSRNLDS